MRYLRRLLLAAAVLLLLLLATAWFWLPQLGWIPVVAGGPRHADAALIPYPDFISGAHAVHDAADLVRQGYVARVLVDAGKPYYGRTTCDYWVAQAPHPAAFECFTLESDDALAHFRYAAAEIRRRAYRSVLVIAPEASSRRYRRILTTLAGSGSPALYLYVTPTPGYVPQAWWKSREGRKIWLVETFKVALTYKPLSFLQSLL